MTNHSFNANSFGDIIIFLISCLAITILIEVLLAFIFKVRKKNLLIVALAQIVTNPIVVLVSNIMGTAADSALVFILVEFFMEICAVILEWIVYKEFFQNYAGKLKPLVLSLVLNAGSFIFGQMILILIRFLA